MRVFISTLSGNGDPLAAIDMVSSNLENIVEWYKKVYPNSKIFMTDKWYLYYGYCDYKAAKDDEVKEELFQDLLHKFELYEDVRDVYNDLLNPHLNRIFVFIYNDISIHRHLICSRNLHQ